MANENNLTPFVPGQSGNPDGRPKGSLNLSTIVKELLADPELADKVIKKKPSWWDTLPNKNLAEALTIAMLTSALNGSAPAANWVRKTGYGDQLNFAGEIKHEGVIIYKPEKYPRKIVDGEVVITPQPSTTQPMAVNQPTAPLPAPNPDLMGIA